MIFFPKILNIQCAHRIYTLYKSVIYINVQGLIKQKGMFKEKVAQFKFEYIVVYRGGA